MFDLIRLLLTLAKVSFSDFEVVYETSSFDGLCEHVFADMRTFCSQNSLQLHMTGLTRTLLGFTKSSSFPAGFLGIALAFFFCKCHM